MAVKKLSCNIQSLFSSSIHLFSYKRAIEELVYNALDAESTSIAIRLHIQENKIQVIDNGNGVAKEDFDLLGQRYATSKFVDISRFQSAPNSYGYRGQALSSMIEVSKTLKITSRFYNMEQTWTKTFYKGRCKEMKEASVRPSKGTTVEINGFLYNLKIQSKAINYMNEVNDIKTFLEQLSLIHYNLSISFRDDSMNEIIFKVHKHRDIFQTLKSLYDIEKSDIQELQVEKGQYKAIAYISKKLDHGNRYHWIFLNKRIVSNTSLHKLIQKHLKKKFRCKSPKKLKTKNNDDFDNYEVTKNRIPIYFIFITCPYYDYEVSNTSKQSTLEFKSWIQINELIEKVAKFYTRDLLVSEIKRVDNDKICAVEKTNDTRERVRGIMKKFLGSNRKNPGISQMQNGVKGKLVKRKKKKIKNIALSKVLSPKNRQCGDIKLNMNDNISLHEVVKASNKLKTTQIKHKLIDKKVKSINKQVNNKNSHKTTSKPIIDMNESAKISKIITDNCKSKKRKFKKDALIKAFESKSDTVVKRCNMLAKQVENCIPYIRKRSGHRIVVNETINYSRSVINNNKNISIKKRIEETIIHDYIPLKPTKFYRKEINDMKKKYVKSSHDLVKSVIDSHENLARSPKDYESKETIQNKNLKTKSNIQLPQLTFQSHHYEKSNYSKKLVGFNENVEAQKHNSHNKQQHFISKHSIENFVRPNNILRHKYSKSPIWIVKKNHKSNQHNNITNTKSYKMVSKKITTFNFSNGISSHTIDCSESKDIQNMSHTEYSSLMNHENTFKAFDRSEHFMTGTMPSNIGLTYTLTESEVKQNPTNNLRPIDEHPFRREEHLTQQSIVEKYCDSDKITVSNVASKQADSLNVIFDSNANSSVIDDTNNEQIEPLNICEAVLSSGDNIVLDKMFVTKNNLNELNDSGTQVNSSNYFDLDFNKDKEETIKPPQITSPENVIITDYTLEDEMNNVDYNLQEIDIMVQDYKEIPKSHLTNDKILIMNNVQIQEQNKNHANVNEDGVGLDVNDDDIVDNFNMKNRPRFLPKGMSPILRIQNWKITEDQKLDYEYFQKDMYNRFMDNIQVHSEIYEAYVQNPNDVTTKAIDKVNNRLNKENSSLTFNTKSLKEAKVLGQVDRKFIATVLKGESGLSEYLVLFDQHAVHERIRLEDNLADYFNNNMWKSVKVDDVVLKLSKEEILYLHNYKEKFTLFGLNWTVLNNQEIKLHAIPEAILGKNPRQAEKVIDAVKNLISEQVSVIKTQKGCSALYPKSIMDLVFSEACRYAIMFGDCLSKSNCIELIRNLSSCKTPFQCAHGRPVMAVILEIPSNAHHYQINKEKLRQLTRKNMQTAA